jgi:sec-independent protein translocase protein TatB
MELLLCVIIAVVVLGPERFPQAAVQVAKALKFLRGYATEATLDLRESSLADANTNRCAQS